MKNSKIAVFVPLYNEQEKIGKVLRDIREAAGNSISMLLVADDGSTDGSEKTAAIYTDHIIHRQENGGNGAITRDALSYIAQRGNDWDYVIRIDGDGQHDPSLLPVVIEALKNADIVVCSRFHEQSDKSQAMFDRHCLNMTMAHIIASTTKWPITDARSGFFGYRWSILAPVMYQLKTSRYGIPLELLLRVWQRSPQARYVEIPHQAKYQKGISKRLDEKYEKETRSEKVRRLAEAYDVFLKTCEELGIA